ncbi:hypothetical protein FSARC_3234 [Fusarium sarcochroum]|uniref:Clr5 domain-containing protein n=1 Tax=Fusarium sarcochroum TaxID=1208366 RepID=A0A8H4U4C8_9HYPO|nr:hypothetical protein FSARC_3234 [Fusarium sarcochroum]
MPSFKTPAIPEETWAHYEPYIRHFLVAKGMQVGEVVTELARHNFRIKKPQLEHRINRWQIGKAIRPEIWRHVGLQIAKRQHENRRSRVIHRGKTLELSKVRDQTARNQTCTGPASPDLALITNAQVVVCTPPVLPHEPAWPSDLPWLRFYDKTFIPLASHALQAMDLDPSTTRGQRAWTAESIVTNDHRSISRLDPASPKLQASTLETIIGTSMPEYYPGENWNRAQSLLKGSDKEVLQASLSIVLYNLSNNLFDPFDDHDWEVNVQVLHDCGIMSLPLPATLDDVTINGILRSLFHAALWRLVTEKDKNEPLAVLRWTLSAGRIPTSLVFIPEFETTITPLQAASYYGDFDSMELLLRAGADPNFVPKDDFFSPLELAVSGHFTSRRLNTVHALLEHGATTRPDEALRLAVESQDMEIAKMILRGTPSIADIPEEPIDPLLKQIVLEAADHEDAKRLGFVMDLLSHLCPARPRKDFVTVETFYAAAAAWGHIDKILLLHDISPGDTPMEKPGFTLLHAAAGRGHRDICALLLNLYGSDVLNSCSYPPLHVASLYGRPSIVQLFIDEGASVNAIPVADGSPHDQYPMGRSDSYVTFLKTLKTASPLEMIREVLRSPFTKTSETYLCAAALIRAGAKVIAGDVVLALATQSPFEIDFFEMLSAVLDFGGDPDEMSEKGLTALQLSLRPRFSTHIADHTAKVSRLLLDNGALLTGGEANSAAILGDWTLVDRLLSKGELLLDFDDASTTALEAAIGCHHDSECLVKALELLPYIYSPGCLCAAILTRRYWLVDHLLANRVTRNQPDCLEGTAISLAVVSGDLPLLRKLLAILLPQPATAKMPSASHMWETPKNRNGDSWWRFEGCCSQVSPLAMAAYFGATDGFYELLHHGFLADQMTWSEIASKDRLSMAQALVDNNQRLELDGLSSSVELTDFLICSIRNRNKELVLLLLESYPNINRHYWFSEAKSGFTPLQAAADTGNSDLIEIFLRRGADVNVSPATRNGATALQFAAMRGHLGIAKRLIDLGADPNAPAALINGRTALEGAAENGRLDMLHLLLERGTLTKGAGRHQYIRAIKLAIRQGHCPAERLLRGYRNWEEEDDGLFEQEENFDRQDYLDEVSILNSEVT